MNALELIWEGSFWQEQAIRLSLMLLHFIWQGLLVGLVASIALLCCKRKSANCRYWIACGAFFCLPLLALVTFAFVEVPTEFAAAVVLENAGNVELISNGTPETRTTAGPLEQGVLSAPDAEEAVLVGPDAAVDSPTIVTNAVAELNSGSAIQAIYPFLPVVAAGYLAGVLLMLVRLQIRIWRGARLCSRSPEATDQALLGLIKKLAHQAGLKVVPVIRYCDRVVVPTVVGILKPVVLVPASIVSQLTVDELTAILNHELAHIRRFDPVVQVVQKAVEALLFFHPVTWWLSRRIRIERENCCDDIASRDTGQLPYAAALLRMAELCVSNDSKRSRKLASLAADGSSTTEFASRIRRLIGAEDTPSFGLSRRAVYLLLTVGLLASVSFAASTAQPGYKTIDPSESTEFNIHDGQAKAENVSKFNRVENIVWSKKDRNGLRAGAKLLSATGKLKLGDPVVVQFVLKNDTDKEQTFILQACDSHPTLGENNRLELNVIGNSQNTFQHTLKPGETLEKRQYRVSVDTTGMPAGNYNITSGSAFWQAKKDSPNAAMGIPFRMEIPFTLGEPDSMELNQPPADENPETKIYWGKPSGNLILGMRLPKGRQTWPDDQADIEGQLFLFNAGEDEIELTYELPANPADWNMHVTSGDDDKFVRLDSTWYTGEEPQRTRTILVPAGKHVAITDVRAEVTTDGKTAEETIKGPTLRIRKEKSKFEYGDPKRLINQQGRFNFHAALTVRPTGLVDSVVVVSAAPVVFTIGSDEDRGDAGDPEALKGEGGDESPKRLSKDEISKRSPFSAFGCVTDSDGKPLADVEVRSATGIGTLIGGGRTRTDANGNYKLNFGPGIRTKVGESLPHGVGVQAAHFYVQKTGWRIVGEENYKSFLMTDQTPKQITETINREGKVWGKSDTEEVVFAGKPKQIDFTLKKETPALTVEKKRSNSSGDRAIDEGRIPLGDVVWWDAGDGLEAGFWLTSPTKPNQRIAENSIATYQILVRNKSKKEIEFLARLLPHEKRDAPFLIPSDNINAELKAAELSAKFRAVEGPARSIEPAYQIKLAPGESAIIRSQRAQNELVFYVGDGEPEKPVAQAKISKAGMNWIVQPLQIHRSIPAGGTGLLGRAYQLTKVDKDGNVRSEAAIRRVAEPGGKVLYPRIQLEVGTLNANAVGNAKTAAWGEVDKGLQCGVRLLNARTTFEVGETLEGELLWRNVSKKSIRTPIPRRLDLVPQILDSTGQEQKIDFGGRFDLFPGAEELSPGEVRSLGAFKIRLVLPDAKSPKSNAEPAHISLKPGKYSLSGSGGVSGVDTGSPKAGKVEFVVASENKDDATSRSGL